MQSRYALAWDGRQLAEDMAVRGLRQMDVAQKAGVSQVTVSRMVGGAGVSAVAAKKIARVLGQRVDRYLLAATPRRAA